MAKYETLQELNGKLAKSENLSEHNKEVLEDFFSKMLSKGDSKSYMRTLSSRISSIKELIDFRLDEPDKSDIESIFAQLNSDMIQKKRKKPSEGGNYSVESKESYVAFLKKFYNQFIKEEGEGYRPDVDGPSLLEDCGLEESSEIDLDRDKIPTPEEVKEVSKNAKNLTHRAMILFGWATGFRNCEWMVTEDYSEPLRWKHVTFHEDEMKVKCPEGKTGSRTIWTRTAKPIMEKLKEASDNSSPEDPVFTQINAEMRCPDCFSKLDKKNRATYRNRKYRCPECDWEGGIDAVEKYHKPMDDDSLRNVLKTCFKRSDVDENLYNTPHKFYRSARAIFWAVEGKNEAWLRKWFGWSQLTNTPQHYIDLVDNDLRRGIRESYGDEKGELFDTDALKPIVCGNCGTHNSAIWNFCNKCETSITYTGLRMERNDPDSKENEIKHEVKDEWIAIAQDRYDIPESEIEDFFTKRVEEKLEELET